MDTVGSKPDPPPIIFHEASIEDVREVMESSLNFGEKWKDWSMVRQHVSRLNFFGITAEVENVIIGMVLWRPDRKTARIFFTWASPQAVGLLPALLKAVTEHIPEQLKTASAVINEDALELCQDFKVAGYRSIKVLPKAFEGRDGILFCKPREVAANVPDEGQRTAGDVSERGGP